MPHRIPFVGDRGVVGEGGVSYRPSHARRMQVVSRSGVI